MEIIFQDPVDDFCNNNNLVDDLVKEMETLSHAENDTLKIENVELKNQLKIGENMFQTVMVEQSKKVTFMRNTMEIFFQTLGDKF
jgi:regulator of replication initiation timing